MGNELTHLAQVYVPWWALVALFFGCMALFWKYYVQTMPDEDTQEDDTDYPDGI